MEVDILAVAARRSAVHNPAGWYFAAHSSAEDKVD